MTAPGVTVDAAIDPIPAHRAVRLVVGSHLPLEVVVAAFVASRVVFYAIGVRMTDTIYSVTDAWQGIDAHLLRRAPWQSLFYLHSQPPLLNTVAAVLIRLPEADAQVLLNVGFILMGLSLGVATFLLGRDLGLSKWPAAAVAIVFEIGPVSILYENWPFYTYPTAVLLTWSAVAAARYLRTGRRGWGVALFASSAAVVLLNSSFQAPFLIGALAAACVVFRRHFRSVAAVAVVPLALVAAWYVKDAVLFGTYSTSSWLGMNLARTTLVAAPPGVVGRLVAEHRLTPLALIAPFQAASAYQPTYAPRVHTGVYVLDEIEKPHGLGPNLDNKAIISVSSQYLHDDLAFIRADPIAYLTSVARAVRLWFVAGDQYLFLKPNVQPISGYVRVYDRVIGLQPEAFAVPIGSAAATAAQLSFGSVLVDLLALFGSPFVCWRHRRDRWRAAALGYVWFVVAYVFVLTSLLEYGENNRFHDDLGPLASVLAAVVAFEAVGALTARRRRGVRDAGAAHPPSAPALS